MRLRLAGQGWTNSGFVCGERDLFREETVRSVWCFLILSRQGAETHSAEKDLSFIDHRLLAYEYLPLTSGLQQVRLLEIRKAGHVTGTRLIMFRFLNKKERKKQLCFVPKSLLLSSSKQGSLCAPDNHYTSTSLRKINHTCSAALINITWASDRLGAIQSLRIYFVYCQSSPPPQKKQNTFSFMTPCRLVTTVFIMYQKRGSSGKDVWRKHVWSVFWKLCAVVQLAALQGDTEWNVWSRTGTETRRVLSCAARFYKLCSELGDWTCRWGKDWSPGSGWIFFLLLYFSFVFVCFSSDVNKCFGLGIKMIMQK